MDQVRLMVWPRKRPDGMYTYVLVGMLVTDKALDNLRQEDGGEYNELVLHGSTHGVLGFALEVLPGSPPAPGCRNLDANTVLTSLTRIIDGEQHVQQKQVRKRRG